MEFKTEQAGKMVADLVDAYNAALVSHEAGTLECVVAVADLHARLLAGLLADADEGQRGAAVDDFLTALRARIDDHVGYVEPGREALGKLALPLEIHFR